MSKITPFLWFNDNAEEAVDFYCSLFPNSRRTNTLRSPTQTSVATGQVLTISFELNGQSFVALNGGPQFPFTEAVSFFVSCKDQAEIDHYWNAITSNGGSESRCGWCKDKFGLSWQIVPDNIMALIDNLEGMKAMMTMNKLDIAALERAGQQ
jgi:predicted 3-demethylubiquinone-9 3-methyltransferase (glyoxalase superfamily)